MSANTDEARSLHLSTVLDDIGVNKGVIMLRRNTHLTVELLLTSQVRLDGNDNDVFIFGSQSEGTTTIGMRSDTDVMFHKKMFRGVQNESDQTDKNEYIPFRVLRNEKSSPQCCRLHVLSAAAPDDWDNNKVLGGDASDFVSIHDGQTFLKTTFQLRELRLGDETRTRHGPAITIDDKTDYVKALGTNLMNECKFMFDRFRPGHWPKASTIELAQQCLTFFVPQGPADRENRMIFDAKSKVVKFDVRVGIDDMVYSGQEFRFSTPTMEILLMFDMGIVQLKVYVTMKMMRKELLKNVVADRLSTFHFKTALLCTVETFPKELWRENNLEQCIIYCLVTLRRWMKRRYCPHYTIRVVNLFSGKLKYAEFPKLIVMVTELIDTMLECLNELVMDNLGLRLKALTDQSRTSFAKVPTRSENHTWIVENLLGNNMYKLLSIPLKVCELCRLNLSSHEIIDHHTVVWDETRRHLSWGLLTEKDIVTHTGSLFVASVKASSYLEKGLPVSFEITEQFEKSLKIDLLSARLKYASLLLKIGQVESAAKLLFDIEASLPPEVCEFSMHLPTFRTPGPELVKTITEKSITAAVQAHVASCVIYTPLEVNCGPKHLAYEMYRTVTDDDKRDRNNRELWMCCAVTDSIPYLYYLQYLVYKQMCSSEKAKSAISKLRNKVSDDGEDMCCKENPVMNRNLETSLNLLGNCYELEDDHKRAWECYTMSVALCPMNNAARWHMLVMLINFYQLVSK